MLRLLTATSSMAAVAVGLMVTAGWILALPGLSALHPVLGGMGRHAAVCFVLIGASLWWLRDEDQRGWRRELARACAMLVAVACGLTLLMAVAGPVGPFGEAGSLLNEFLPLRVPAPTAIAFLGLSLALLLIDVDGYGWRPSEMLALVAMLVALLALIAYAYNNVSFFEVARQRSLAFHSVLLFVALAFGILAARPRRGLMRLAIGDNVTGVMLRRLLPAAVALPIVGGWIIDEAEAAGWLPPVLSLSYYALLLALGFSILIAHTAVILYRTDMDRERAESHVRMLNARLEARVTERTQELEAANKELEAFSYSVSHDLRAPLRAIDGFGRVLAEDYASQLDEEGHRHLSRIQLAARRMGELIDGLLVLARVTRNDMHRERVDLSDIAADLVASMRRDSGARDVRVDIESGLVVHGDSRLLRVALENLLGNAWKFTRGTREPHITFGRLSDDGETTYFVRDNGAGFDMNYAQRLFGAFERLHRETEFEGTGIGLATVRRIVQRHGGRIWAKSAVGQGATFLFTLPSAAADMTPPDAPAN